VAGEACVEGACSVSDCDDQCTLGERGCTGNSAWLCVEGEMGCTTKTTTACAAGQTCEYGECMGPGNGSDVVAETDAKVAETPSDKNEGSSGCDSGANPSTAGALLLCALLGLAIWRRRTT